LAEKRHNRINHIIIYSSHKVFSSFVLCVVCDDQYLVFSKVYCILIKFRSFTCSSLLICCGMGDSGKPHHMQVTFIWRYQRVNPNPYIEEEQTTQWPNKKSTKEHTTIYKAYTYRTKDRVTWLVSSNEGWWTLCSVW
jgi:hypothetical protein